MFMTKFSTFLKELCLAAVIGSCSPASIERSSANLGKAILPIWGIGEVVFPTEGDRISYAELFPRHAPFMRTGMAMYERSNLKHNLFIQTFA
jgi:hypothetical protein